MNIDLMRQALQDAVVYRMNFCWYPRVPDYGINNKRIKP